MDLVALVIDFTRTLPISFTEGGRKPSPHIPQKIFSDKIRGIDTNLMRIFRAIKTITIKGIGNSRSLNLTRKEITMEQTLTSEERKATNDARDAKTVAAKPQGIQYEKDANKKTQKQKLHAGMNADRARKYAQKK